MPALSDSDLLTLYNEALQAIAKGQSYVVNGRQMTRADLAEVRDTIDWLEARIARGSDTSAGTALASFGGPE